LSIVKSPAQISAGKGVVEVTLEYTTTAPAYISSNIQQRAGDWRWYAGKMEIVPAGKGTIVVRFVTNGGITTDAAAKLGINVYMNVESKYLATTRPWDNSDATVWKDVQAVDGGPLFARATQDKSNTFSGASATSPASGLPTGIIIAVACVVGIVVVAIVVVVIVRRTRVPKEEQV